MEPLPQKNSLPGPGNPAPTDNFKQKRPGLWRVWSQPGAFYYSAFAGDMQHFFDVGPTFVVNPIENRMLAITDRPYRKNQLCSAR